MTKIASRILVPFVTALGLWLSNPSVALAAGWVECKINDIEYDNRLFIKCNNVVYNANVSSGTNCNNASIDQVKVWQSMATAAMLANKTVSMWITDCTVKNFVSFKIAN